MKKSSKNIRNKYPVVFFVFRRPDTTLRVLKEIIKSKPYKLYIFADGPRDESDFFMVNRTRKCIDDLLSKSKINIIKIYRKKNYGLKKSILGGLNEVFIHENAAIILEDDCFPSLNFFDFCNFALNKYYNSTEINTVCGTNVGVGNKKNKNLIVSKYFLPWGWALWKRSWLEYKNVREEDLKAILSKKNNKILAWYLMQVYNLSKEEKVKAWSYRMVIMQIVNEKLSLYPSYNTVSNIGFGGRSSNTLVKTVGSNFEIDKKVKKIINKNATYRKMKKYDNFIAYNLYLTPISFCGLILRKYFPYLVKYIYRKWNK
jgi:hypothetical protein